jgi:hypothetical protein
VNEEEFSKGLIIEEPYKKKLALGLVAMNYVFDTNLERKSFVEILNNPRCMEVVKKSKIEDAIYFPEYVFMQIGNYGKDLTQLLKENINEESFRNYITD